MKTNQANDRIAEIPQASASAPDAGRDLRRGAEGSAVSSSSGAVKPTGRNYVMWEDGFAPVEEKPASPLGRPSDHINVREHIAPNWFTTRGVLLKRSQIEAKGVPSLHQWRFLTVTIDPAPFESRGEGPLEAYLAGKDHMRRFMYACREAGLWSNEVPWAWKLEFHKSGWPHWHILVGRKEPFTHRELSEVLPHLWGLGGTSVEMVRNDSFLYSFKYAFKPVRVEESEMDTLSWAVPQWFLDYSGFRMVKVRDTDGNLTEVQKPVTFQRVRFWQTSKNFYTGKRRELKESAEPQSSWVSRTVREIANGAASVVQVVARRGDGKYLKSALVMLTCTAAHFWHVSSWHAVGRNACFLSVNNAVIHKQTIIQRTQTPWLISQLLIVNRLTLKTADRLQAQFLTLRKC